MASYQDKRQRLIHVEEICARYGYREFGNADVGFRLTRWLYALCWTGTERPSVLFDRATAWMLAHKVLLPGASLLERFVAKLRSRVEARLWRILCKAITPEGRSHLEDLLLVPEGGRNSWLDRLRRGPVRVSAPALVRAIDRLQSVRDLGIKLPTTAHIPPSRLASLARFANNAKATAVARLPSARRVATLIAFVHSLEAIALWRRLTDGLTDQHRQLLDQLLEIRAGGGQSTLAWLRQTACTATPGNFPKLVERLTLVRSLGIDPERATRVHQNYWLKLAREGGQSTVQHLAKLEPLRRYATLTAVVLEPTATLIDEALNMFEHLVGQMFKKSERAHAEQFHASGESINEKVRLYARVGQALIEARSTGGDVFAAIESVLPWSKFESTVAEAQKLAQPEEFDYLALLDESDTALFVSSLLCCWHTLKMDPA